MAEPVLWCQEWKEKVTLLLDDGELPPSVAFIGMKKWLRAHTQAPCPGFNLLHM